MPELSFKGKQHVYAHHMTVPHRPLVLDKKRSLLNGAAASDNLIVKGDNLYALKSLMPRYAGRIKAIYIDPPYNTGNEGWIYNDNVNSPMIKEWLKANIPVDGEDMERHDKWLCMMWPRLQLLKELLSDDGVIFVSIDDNEHHHLRMLMNEIFGENNFVAQFVRKTATSPRMDAKHIATEHDCVICYAREIDNLEVNQLLAENMDTYPFADKHESERGKYKLNKLDRGSIGGDEKMRYPITAPDGSTIWAGGDRSRTNWRWRWAEAKLKWGIENDFIVFRKSREGCWNVYFKQYQRVDNENKPIKRSNPPRTLLTEGFHNELATREIQELFESRAFNYPKPARLIEHLLRLSTGTSSSDASTPPPPPPPVPAAAKSDGDIVLDSFAGSGTTAHAVLKLNQEDGGNRRFILVECEDYADTITAERVRRVIRGVPSAKDAKLRDGLGGSFAFYTLGKPLDMESMLAGKNLPSYSVMAAWLLHTASGLSAEEKDLKPLNKDGLFYRGGQTDYYLRYRPDLEYLRGNESILNEEVARRIEKANQRRKKKAVVFAPGKYLGQRELTKMGITFCQLPYGIAGV